MPSDAPPFKPLRYDEDYRYLADPARRTDFWDPVKYMPMGSGSDGYLSFGGELRERAETFSDPGFGLSGGAKETYLLHRALISADFYWTASVRAFAQIGDELVADKNKPLGSADLNRGDLNQAFIDIRLPLTENSDLVMRTGRQEISLGSQRLVSTRDPQNIRRSFDGIRLTGAIAGISVDVIATRPVLLRPGYFDDSSDHKQAFWGMYTTTPFSSRQGIDLYYLIFENSAARYGTKTGFENRKSLGTIVFGAASGWDWNFEAVYQFGTFGDQDIKAWTFASDSGYMFSAIPWTPRLGLKANIASGDHNPRDKTLGTFNPLFPKFGYFSEADLVSPNNFYDVQPSLTITPTKDVSLTLGWDAIWRQTNQDAVYTVPGVQVKATAGRGGREIGNQVSLDAAWQVDRHIELKASAVHFNAGNAIRSAGGHDVDFVIWSGAYKF